MAPKPGERTGLEFQSESNARLNGRSFPFSMGKVLGGGSSINVMVWARGHRKDWDFFASEAGDPAWCFVSVFGVFLCFVVWFGVLFLLFCGLGV